MMSILLHVLLLNIVKLINADINIYSGTCGATYDADFYTSVIVKFKGLNLLYDDPCSIEFTKDSNKQLLCVKGENVHLECGTKLEYHEGFVKNYISPEVQMTCSGVTLTEWCSSQYQDNIFIVIRKPTRVSSNDDIKLRVYLKDAEDEFGSSFSTTTVLIVTVTVVVLIVISIIVLVVCIRARQRPRPQVMYQTTSGAVSMQTVPATGGYQPPQQTFTGPQGNYNVHPMQTAYPVTEGAQPLFPQDTNTAGSSANRHLIATAPPLETNAPPPSYETVVGATH